MKRPHEQRLIAGEDRPVEPGPQGHDQTGSVRPDLLVAGTDTEVGKTVLSLLLLSALRARGLRALPMKPVETGCAPFPADARALAAVAEDDDDPMDMDDLCPYRFPLPVAPEAAAESAGRRIKVARIQAALGRLRDRSQMVLVESAGGLGSPCAPRLLDVDLAWHLGLPVLLIARDVLGTIGQTLVALRVMRARGVRCVGVVLNRPSDAPAGPEQPTNGPLIEAHAEGVPLLGTLPFMEEPPPRAPGDIAGWARRHHRHLEQSVDLDRLLRGLHEA